MKVLARNRKVIYYANPIKAEDMVDEYGNLSGETELTFSKPKRYERFSYGPMQAYAAALTRGFVNQEPFGLKADYTTPLITDDLNCPVVEESRLWIDCCPIGPDGKAVPHTHVVTAVMPSINYVKVTAKGVSVS